MLVAHRKGWRACAVVLVPLLGGHAAKAEVFPTNSSSVIVDYSVLEQLGTPETLPQMMIPRITPARPAAPAGVRRESPPRPGQRPLRLGMPAQDSGQPVQKETLHKETTPLQTRPPQTARTEEVPQASPPRPLPKEPSVVETVVPAAAPSGDTPNADVLPAPAMPPGPQGSQISIAPTAGGAVVLSPSPSSLLTPPPLPRDVEKQDKKPPSAPAQEDRLEDRLTVLFPATVTDIPEEAKPRLRHLAEQVLRLPEAKLQLVAYAGGGESDAGKARRISLARALAVRSYLMEWQISHTRFDVRALGNRFKEGASDRVDIIVVSR